MNVPGAPASYANELARRAISALICNGFTLSLSDDAATGSMTIPATEAQILLIVPCALANSKSLLQAQDAWDKFVTPARELLHDAAYNELRFLMAKRCAEIVEEMTS